MKWGIERLQELEGITSPGTGEYNVFRNRLGTGEYNICMKWGIEYLRQELGSITSSGTGEKNIFVRKWGV